MKPNQLTTQERQWFVLTSCLLFLFFFRPIEALRLDVYNPDSACYADWLYKFFGASFWNCKYNYYYPGAALLWIPAAAAGYVIGFLTGTAKELWLEPLVGITTFSAFLTALYFNILTYKRLTGKESSGSGMGLPALICLASPVLPYASIHTFLAHSAEFLFTSLTIHFLFERKVREVVIFSTLLVATRPTGVLVGGVIAGFLWDDFRKLGSNSLLLSRANRKWFALVGAIVFALFVRVVTKGYGADPKIAASGTFLPELIANINAFEFLRFLVGDRNGMLFTGFWWLFMFATGAAFFFKLSTTSKGVILWMFAMMLVCIGWGGNGSQDGWFILYRYLISTYAGLLILTAEMERLVPPLLARQMRVLLSLQAIVIAYYTWMNNYAVPKVWELFDGTAPAGHFIRRGISLVVYSPMTVTLFSWFPGLGRLIYRGEHSLAGPRLWILSAITVTVLILIAKTLRSLLFQNDRHLGTKLREEKI